MNGRNPSEREVVPSGLATVAGWTWRLLLIAFGIAVVAAILWQLRVLTVPMFVALLLSTLLVPPVVRLRELGLKHGLATAIVFLGSILVVLVLLYLLASPVASEFRALGPQVEGALDSVTAWLRTGPLNLSQTQIDRYLEQAVNQVRANTGLLRSGLVSGAGFAAELFTGIFLTLVLTFFFTKDGSDISSAVINRLPVRHRKVAHAGAHRAFVVLGGYLRGVALTGVVDAALIGIALWLLGVPLLLPLMILTFFGAFFPVVGATVAGALAALIALVNNGPTDALLVLLAVVIVQQLEGQILQPYLVGRAVSLHPVVILIALTAGAIVAGLLGAFVAVPLVAVVVGVIREVEGQRNQPMSTSPMTAPAPDPTAGPSTSGPS